MQPDECELHPKLQRARAEARMIAAWRHAASQEMTQAAGDAACWYVVRTNRAAQAVAEAMSEARVEVFAATLKVLRRRASSRHCDEVRVALFERYFFVRLRPVGAAFAGVNSFDGVDGLLGSEGVPCALPNATIAELMALAEAPAKKPSPRRMLIGGDTVRVSRGPFEGLRGTVLAPESDKGLVDIEIDVFGRLSPCRLALDALEKLA